MKRIAPAKLAVSARLKGFDEVNLGFTEKEALEEAKRCLNCANPTCVSACPVGIDIPGFIRQILKRDFESAASIIHQSNFLPSVCGRVCPQEELCEAKCILGTKGEPVAIGGLERFTGDYSSRKERMKNAKPLKKKIAVVGSGPSGIALAGFLSRIGYRVTIFEALHSLGGVMRYGIPEFRLPRSIVDREIGFLRSFGAEIMPNHVIGKVLRLEELEEDFDSVYISTGAGCPKFMGIPGEGLGGVYSANEFLTRTNLMASHAFPDFHTPSNKYSRTIIIGGGNVAMDAARTLRRLGSKVTLLYRRSIEEMPARKEEIVNAQEEGVDMLMMTSASRIIGEKRVEGVECVQMMLGAMDESGRRAPIPLDDSEFIIPCDSVIVAIGQGPNQLLASTTDIKRYANGSIIVDQMMRTSRKGVFAGGDAVLGDATVIRAIADAKRAASAIHEYLS